MNYLNEEVNRTEPFLSTQLVFPASGYPSNFRPESRGFDPTLILDFFESVSQLKITKMTQLSFVMLLKT